VTQFDLFGAVERAEQERAAEAQRRTEWRALFEPADWIAPYDCADGTPAGTAVPGWLCPDPDCGVIEPNGCVLGINHGLDPDRPPLYDDPAEPWCRYVHIQRRRVAAGMTWTRLPGDTRERP
jgi:hypothetical protein